MDVERYRQQDPFFYLEGVRLKIDGAKVCQPNGLGGCYIISWNEHFSLSIESNALFSVITLNCFP